MVDVPSERDVKFLQVIGYGKQESDWITQYDTFPLHDGFLARWLLVGRELGRMSSLCGKHRHYLACTNSDLHDEINGRDLWHNTVYNCRSYRCHTCWKYGWAVDKAHSSEDRFLTAEKVLGLPASDVEHISASMPKRLYDLPYRDMMSALLLALKVRGIRSGVAIVHPYRKDRVNRELVFGLHWHILGYIDGGYDRCRSCKSPASVCWSCDGFEGVSHRAGGSARKGIVGDDWMVTLAKNEAGKIEKRESLYGTAWYQLEHSGYLRDVPRFSVIQWFGKVERGRKR